MKLIKYTQKITKEFTHKNIRAKAEKLIKKNRRT